MLFWVRDSTSAEKQAMVGDSTLGERLMRPIGTDRPEFRGLSGLEAWIDTP